MKEVYSARGRTGSSIRQSYHSKANDRQECQPKLAATAKVINQNNPPTIRAFSDLPRKHREKSPANESKRMRAKIDLEKDSTPAIRHLHASVKSPVQFAWQEFLLWSQVKPEQSRTAEKKRKRFRWIDVIHQRHNERGAPTLSKNRLLKRSTIADSAAIGHSPARAESRSDRSGIRTMGLTMRSERLRRASQIKILRPHMAACCRGVITLRLLT